ncbi:Nucleotidyltransferase, partial [Meira miltonrushii]
MSAEASSSRNNGSAGGVSIANVNGAGPSSFAEAQDYIPFDFGDEEEEQEQPVETIKGKDEKGKDKGTKNEDPESKESGKKRKRDTEKPEPPKSSNQRKKEKRQMISGTPWSADVDFDRCLNAAEALHNELIAFADWISPTEQEHECRRLVVQLIRRAIVREWPDAHLEAFGSQNTQLYMPSGDLDLVVVSQSMETQRKENVLRKMAAVLRRHNLAMDVQVIAKAKVPIVKFVCVHGKLKVDISINQTNGIEAANYIRGWLDRLPSIRPLIMAVKLLLVQRGLSEVFSGGLGSYSVICLVINHLQMHPKIQRGELDPALNLGILFLEFLELYGRNFGYDNVGISIRGRGNYFTKVSRGWRDDRRPYMLSIEDPLDPANDISKGSYAIISVRQAFAGAFDILSAALSQKANEIKKRKAAEHWGDGVNPTDEDEEARAAILNVARNPSSSNKDPHSLLGSVIGIPHEMFKSRRDLESLWQSGIMQNKLGRKPPAVGSPEPS